MAGVNRSNVAVTDTFDTWRIRTNELNTTLNEATNAITANTIIFRDDSSNYTANAATLNAIAVTHGTSTSAVTVTSALAAASDGTKASILTTGGIYATLDSKFAADLTIGTDLSVEGNSTLGNAVTDTITFTGRVASGTHLLPIANNSTNLGSADLQFQQVYSEQNLIVATQDINANVFSVTSANGAGHTAVLKNDAAVTGTVLQVLSDSSSTGTRDIAKIVNDNTSATGATALHIQSDAGRAVFIDANLADGGYALQVDSEIATTNTMAVDAATTTATGALFNFPSLTTGSGIDVTSASSNLGTAGAVVEISQTSGTMSSANAAVLSLKQAGAGTTGLKIETTHATANTSLRIDSSQTTENVIEVQANALTSGDMLNANTNAEHSGQMFSLTSYNAADTARGEALHILYRTANTTAKAITVANSSADIFSVEQSGDTVIGRDLQVGGNLHVVGTTTQINSSTTLVKDKAIVLGAQSNVVTGATYTAANPAVVTSTAHGLSDNDIIFVVSSTGTAIVSEQLVKVTSKTTNTFEAETIAGVDINSSSDSTSRTFSWVGAQTDAAVDDSGIQIPGSTAVHSFLWDDTSNYWTLNDSTKIDSTGQFVVPVGTTAQKPSGTATATVPAATVGALRYNTDNAKFEGVTAGTTYENMSTEAFATAMAIALG